MRIEFLNLQGCPNCPVLRRRLDEALRTIEEAVDVLEFDLEDLARNGDVRVGFGAPTILVNHKDLYGLEPQRQSFPACRVYRPQLPTADELAIRLRVAGALKT